MARRPKRPCAAPGCPALISSGSYCEAHAKQRRQRQPDERPSAAARGYDRKWRRIRAQFLKKHPECVECGQPATDVDHIVPRAAGGSDQWSNLQPLCHACHSRKTVAQDGGFGNARGGAM